MATVTNRGQSPGVGDRIGEVVGEGGCWGPEREKGEISGGAS